MEQRGKGKFYYRVHRENGRLVKKYIGSGDAAAAAAARDAAIRAEKEELRQIGVLFDALRCVIEVLIEQQMIAAGYHRHDRGRWRKARVSSQ